jgi:hypothetical protein|mmetsp:Transcript_9815/g.36477  ORF Transcript_9815/g.36477 Transcript_9815/m.36477 type:complete len:82 (-) Transcript_9815:190-435(-)
MGAPANLIGESLDAFRLFSESSLSPDWKSPAPSEEIAASRTIRVVEVPTRARPWDMPTPTPTRLEGTAVHDDALDEKTRRL